MVIPRQRDDTSRFLQVETNRKRGAILKTCIIQRPAVEIVLLDGAQKPLAFSHKRLALLQDVFVEFPELPIMVRQDGIIKWVEISQIELFDTRTLHILNTSI